MNKKNILTKNNLMIKINTETHKHKSMNDALWSMKLQSYIEYSSFPYCTTVEDLLNALKKGFRIDTPSTSSIYKQDPVFLPDGCNFKWYFTSNWIALS